ncbi:hypothetical protein QBC45DRAFT_441646 [Copromyces sp. CBS 386.78]|nr:hypothetical protein QBC45DRAFT_441646 [Copromyces sp. CBS 386.78]
MFGSRAAAMDMERRDCKVEEVACASHPAIAARSAPVSFLDEPTYATRPIPTEAPIPRPAHQATACDEADAVSCTNLAPGAKKACCPTGKLGLELASTEGITVLATGGSMTVIAPTSCSLTASSPGRETVKTTGASSSTPTSLTPATGVVALSSASAFASASSSPDEDELAELQDTQIKSVLNVRRRGRRERDVGDGSL